jgi:hypothetical protein
MKLGEIRTPLLTVLIGVALVSGGVATHGQPPQGGGAAGGMLVDFTAVGADGKPVTDLTAADVTIKIAGKSRAITDLALKKLTPAAPAAGAPAAAAAAPATTGPAAPFFTNDPGAAPAPAAARGGRAFLIVVDNESLPSATEAPIKAAIENLLKDLTPSDRVAFSTAPKDTAQIGFGSSLAAVRQAVAGFRGLSGVTTTDALCRTSETLNLLKALIQQAPGGETPTAVIVIARALSTPGTSNSTTGGNCNVATDHYQSLASAMAGARANMYVVQGDSATGRDNGMENLASVSGAGSVMRVANDGFAPRVLGEASTYWVATLAPDPSDKPNQSQRLELKTTKEGVTVRTRPEVMMSRVSNAAGAPAAAPGGKADPKTMATSTAPYPDVQLRGWALAQRGVGNKMNVLVQFEPVDPNVKLTAVRLGYFDANNKGASLDVTNIAVYPITTGVPLDVGQYRLRVAVTDANGKGGAVDMKVDTSLISAGPFKMSGLMLLLAKDGKNSPRLQFTEGDKVAAMFEMYGVPNATPMVVGFEVVMPDGTTKQFRPTGQMPSNEPDKFTIFGDVPDLPAGDYVVRAVVQQQGSERGQASRTLRILKK